MAKSYAMLKANVLLKQNIGTLLRARRQNNKDLAMWCRKSESWISKVLNNPERGIPLKYLDRIADFFGIATYQLLQPGITPLSERRRRQRRSGQDRRISQAQREMLEVAPRYIAGDPDFSQTNPSLRPTSKGSKQSSTNTAASGGAPLRGTPSSAEASERERIDRATQGLDQITAELAQHAHPDRRETAPPHARASTRRR